MILEHVEHAILGRIFDTVFPAPFIQDGLFEVFPPMLRFWTHPTHAFSLAPSHPRYTLRPETRGVKVLPVAEVRIRRYALVEQMFRNIASVKSNLINGANIRMCMAHLESLQRPCAHESTWFTPRAYVFLWNICSSPKNA